MLNPNVLGGALLPHAPQFFTQPDTERKEIIASVQKVAADIGRGLKALKPDLWIVIANDHAQQFFHNCAPPFTIHVGGEAYGEFAGRKFHYVVAGEVGFALVRELYRSGFDPAFTSTAEIDYALGIPMTHLGIEDPILPIYVNAYLPPQPTMERCYLFGQALARGVRALGLRVVVVASGGMSHFPGTERYGSPDLAFDNAVLEPLRQGRLKTLLGYDEKILDDTGNIELRCWSVAAGALGERKPDVVQMDPSWHHNYASLGWYTPNEEARLAPHYPPIAPELAALTGALHTLANSAEARQNYYADPGAYAQRFKLSAEQARMLVNFDAKTLVDLGVHPLVPFLARLHFERERGKKA